MCAIDDTVLDFLKRAPRRLQTSWHDAADSIAVDLLPHFSRPLTAHNRRAMVAIRDIMQGFKAERDSIGIACTLWCVCQGLGILQLQYAETEVRVVLHEYALHLARLLAQPDGSLLKVIIESACYNGWRIPQYVAAFVMQLCSEVSVAVRKALRNAAVAAPLGHLLRSDCSFNRNSAAVAIGAIYSGNSEIFS